MTKYDVIDRCEQLLHSTHFQATEERQMYKYGYYRQRQGASKRYCSLRKQMTTATLAVTSQPMVPARLAAFRRRHVER